LRKKRLIERRARAWRSGTSAANVVARTEADMRTFSKITLVALVASVAACEVAVADPPKRAEQTTHDTTSEGDHPPATTGTTTKPPAPPAVAPPPAKRALVVSAYYAGYTDSI